MAGKTEIFYSSIFAFTFVAVLCDLIYGKIYNWWTLSFLVVGIATSAFLGGWGGGFHSLLGVGAALMLYGWMFWLGWMGGGDVKFLMALGAWGGAHFAVEVGVLGVILGGFVAFSHLLINRQFLSFFHRMFQFLYSIFVPGLVIEKPNLDPNLKMPFGIAMGLATVWTLFWHPMDDWIFFLWSQ